MTIDDGSLTGPEADHALAAEFALGLLEGDELQIARDRMAVDAVFAAEVRMWQERLAELALALTPVMAPARARHAVRERLGHSVAPLSVDPADRVPVWRGSAGWLTGLAVAAALAVAVFSPALRGPQDRDGQQTETAGYRARLVSDDNALLVDAQISGREMQVTLQAGAAAQGRDLEIWWIDPDLAAPVSLGLLPAAGGMRMSLPGELEPGADIRIALSDEPAGGSPTGQATGPIVAIAPFTSL